ncbi:MAG: ThuA domain-containing protein [Candidatus Hydrogenedentes bacterium]|nr:ThuA domain-containing protein [Candidatus Hydrogenedentota bacterium]
MGLALAGLALTASAAEKTKIVLVAGKASHGRWQHEHKAGCLLLADRLNKNMPGVEAVVTTEGWPKDDSIFDGAAAVIMYCDGGAGHMVNPHAGFFQGLMDKGVGMACLHYAVEAPKGKEGGNFLNWLGGYFEPHWSVNPHWTADYKVLPDHPIAQGVNPFSQNDEWYYHMRFRDGMEGVTPILTALPPAESLSRPDGPHEGNPAVREAVKNGEAQHMAWAYERPNGGRSFGFTGGHFHKNWGNDDFRKLVLNAICWVAKVDVPEGGVPSETPSTEELAANQDEPAKPGEE